MFNIRLICVGKLKDRFYIDGVKEYNKRLSGYCRLDICEITEQRLPDNPSDAEIISSLSKESAVIEERLIAGFALIVLCVEGSEYSSTEFADLISNLALNGISKLCFVIGGSHGLHERIKERADVKLSLSKMTFPHNFSRVILLEQIYRAFKIIEGGKYHK